ncbi:MAG: GGDEF domain-containing protein [Spirulinaceae cyanobacterium]
MIQTRQSFSVPHTSHWDDQGLPISKPQAIMGASFLVVGGKEFLATFVERYIQLFEGKIEMSSSQEIIPLIARQQPDILIVQAGYLDNAIYYADIKQQAKSNWIYFIILEVTSLPCLDAVEQLTKTAQALENGADAYLQVSYSTPTDTSTYLIQQQDRLFLAQIEVGLQRVRKYREMRETNDLLSSIALADPLTGLSNRRALDWELGRQIENSWRQKIPLSLIILDVDCFKSVNDSHGHLVGDRVLKSLAQRLKAHLRLQDRIFRYGGEEFVILLGQVDVDRALPVAQRLRQVVEEETFYINKNLSLAITISLGLANLKATDDGKGLSLLKRADENLLTAKVNGRNQVVSE